MRRCVILSALALVLTVGSAAHAQRRGPFGWGADPTNLVFVPIDTTVSNAPIAQPQNRSTGFSLLSFMPRFLLPSAKPVIGQSTFPTPAQMPGADYLKGFQYRGARPVGN